MIQALVLICALSSPCDRDHAADILIVPGITSQIPTQCLKQAAAYLAGAPSIDLRGYTVRVTCGRAGVGKRRAER